MYNTNRMSVFKFWNNEIRRKLYILLVLLVVNSKYNLQFSVVE